MLQRVQIKRPQAAVSPPIRHPALAPPVLIDAPAHTETPVQDSTPEEATEAALAGHSLSRLSVFPSAVLRAADAPTPPPPEAPNDGDGTDVSGAVASGLSGGGQGLDSVTRSFMEPRFGHDFSQVKIHTDSRASQSAEAVAARAYTVGGDIAFRSGEYQPGSDAGKRLLAHELTHVVQQGAATTAPAVQRDTNPAAPAGQPGAAGAPAPDYSKMPWPQLLPHAHGDTHDPVNAKGWKRIATVQNTPGQAPTVNYDDKHTTTDPAAGTQPGQDYDTAVTAAIAKIVAGRGAIPARPIGNNPYGTKGGNFYDPVVAGWKPKDDKKQSDFAHQKELNDAKKTEDPQAAEYQKWANGAVPTGVDLSKPDDAKKWQVFQKTMPLEGRLGTVTTFDKTLTVGVGFSSAGGQAEKVIGRVFGVLPEVRDVAFSAGLTASAAGAMTVVDTDHKWILAGGDAAAYVQTNQALLSLLVDVSQGTLPTAAPAGGAQTPAAGTPSPDGAGAGAPAAGADAGQEQQKQRQAWLDAQWQTFLSAALAGIPSDILAWPIDSVVLATHSRHGAPGLFPWSFWQAHANPDMHAMISAMYDQLQEKKQMFWLHAICGGQYKSTADAVEKEKTAPAPMIGPPAPPQ